MDFSLKHWRNDEEEQEKAAAATKLPRLLLNSHHHHQSLDSSALPLFTSEPTSNLSAPYLSDNSAPTPSAKLPTKIRSCFSLSQWQELELQALIFRHMMAGAAVPPELLHLVKKSLITSPSPYYLCNPLHQYYHHYQPAMLQSGYGGRAAMDPEPGRCRRTDGKKWRCSRDVVAGQKYCERHMHRGRNRSRKPVEISTSTNYGGGGGGGSGDAILKSMSSTTQAVVSTTVVGGGPYFGLSEPVSSVDLLNRRSSEKIIGFQTDNGCRGRTLRRFFDDWPRSEDNTGSSAASATNLCMSTPGNHPSSDFSLKLGTGDGEEPRVEAASGERGSTRQLNWCTAWEATTRVAPMGGPLAEALRSSTSSTSSPTSVLHRLPRRYASETSS